MKAFEYLKTLTDKEYKELVIVMSDGRNDKLLKLLMLLKKLLHTNYPSHPAIYEKIYGQQYSKKKDYLVRNLLRMLSRELESFMKQKSFQQLLNEDPQEDARWQLRIMIERNLHKYVKPGFEKAKQLAIDEARYEFAYQPYGLYSMYVLSNETQLTGSKQMIEICEERMQMMKRYTAEQVWRLQNNHNDAVQILKGLNKDAPNLKKEASKIDFKGIADLNGPEKHWQNMVVLHRLQGQERMEHYKQMSEHLAGLKIKRYQEQYFNIMAKVAYEYFLQGDFEGVSATFSEMIEKEEVFGELIQVMLIQNICHHLLVMHKPEQILQLLERHKEQMLLENRHEDIYYLYCGLAYLQLGRYSDAMGIYRNLSNAEAAARVLHYRYIDMLALMGEGAYEAAASELQAISKLATKELDYADIPHKKIHHFISKVNKAIAANNSGNSKPLQHVRKEGEQLFTEVPYRYLSKTVFSTLQTLINRKLGLH